MLKIRFSFKFQYILRLIYPLKREITLRKITKKAFISIIVLIPFFFNHITVEIQCTEGWRLFYFYIFYKCTGKFSLLYTNEIKKITEPSSLKSDLRGLIACTWICHYTYLKWSECYWFNVMIRKPHTCIINAATYFS